jgi:hypothetical protein
MDKQPIGGVSYTQYIGIGHTGISSTITALVVLAKEHQ